MKEAEDTSQFSIYWIRGGKKIDTRTRPANKGVVRFGEKFMMKTTLEFDTEKKEYIPKPSQLQVIFKTGEED